MKMKFLVNFRVMMVAVMMVLLSAGLSAQTVNVGDTIEFTATTIEPELDFNAGLYIYTFKDADWKSQVHYYTSAGSQFGIFSDDDCHLSADGKNYNFIRPINQDWKFYSFQHVDLSVTNQAGATVIEVNALINDLGRWKRVLIHGFIPGMAPTDTIHSDLGSAFVTHNNTLGLAYNVMEAENADYSLMFGLYRDTIADGTYYAPDMLRPEIVDKQTGDSIELDVTQQQVLTITHRLDTFFYDAQFFSTSNTLYHFTFYSAPLHVEVTDTVNIDFGRNVALQDISEIYGCYQLGGENAEYAVAIAVQADSFVVKTTWGMEDVVLSYCRMVDYVAQVELRIAELSATADLHQAGLMIIHANIVCTNGTRYLVDFTFELPGYIPTPKDTVRFDFGEVLVLDYTKGMGIVGIGANIPGEAQINFFLNTYSLSGTFTNEDFVTDLSFIMLVNDADSTYAFHDAWVMSAQMDSIAGDTILMQVNMLAVDTVLYEATLRLSPKACLSDQQYSLGVDDGVQIVAIREGATGTYAEYTVQLQKMDGVIDENDFIVGDGFAFSFYLAASTGIAGRYTYGEGTLAADEPHLIFEGGTEIRVAPVAGWFELEAKQAVSLSIGLLPYHTYLYDASFAFVGQNAVMYEGSGQTYAVCVDGITGLPVVLSETVVTALEEALAEQGLCVRKVLQNGMILIEQGTRLYDASGRMVK